MGAFVLIRPAQTFYERIKYGEWHNKIVERIHLRLFMMNKHCLYPAYTPSGVPWLGDVPPHWDLVQLGRIGRISKGTGGTKEDEAPEGIPCIRYGDLYTSHKFHIIGSRTLVTEAKALEYTPIQYGDILFAGSGETIEEIGKSAVNLMESPACCGGDVILFRPDIEIDARFSGYAIDCSQSQYQKSCMGRGITIMHIYGDELKRLWVALPPIPEQRAIVRYLDYVNRRIRRYVSAKRKLIALLEEEKQAVVNRAVTRGLDPNVRLKPSGVEWLGDVPEHWEVASQIKVSFSHEGRPLVDQSASDTEASVHVAYQGIITGGLTLQVRFDVHVSGKDYADKTWRRYKL